MTGPSGHFFSCVPSQFGLGAFVGRQRWTPRRHDARTRQAAISIKRTTPSAQRCSYRQTSIFRQSGHARLQKKGSRGFGWRPASTRGFRVPLRVLAFALNSGRPGNICGEGACIDRKRRTKPAEGPLLRGSWPGDGSDADAADHGVQIISVTSWYHLAFFVISIAMFGLTAGAVFVYLRKERFRPERLSYDLAVATLAFALTTDLAILVQLTLVTGASPSLTSLVAWAEFALCLAFPFFFRALGALLRERDRAIDPTVETCPAACFHGLPGGRPGAHDVRQPPGFRGRARSLGEPQELLREDGRPGSSHRSSH